MATVFFGLIGVALMLACFVIAMSSVPLESLNMRLVLGLREMGILFLLLSPVILFAGAVQLFLASFARTFKEAQTYLSLALFVPMMPGMVLLFHQAPPQDWMAAVPILSQQFLSGQILRGEALDPMFVGLSVASTLILAAVFIVWTVRLFRSETFFFRG